MSRPQNDGREDTIFNCTLDSPSPDNTGKFQVVFPRKLRTALARAGYGSLGSSSFDGDISASTPHLSTAYKNKAETFKCRGFA